MMHYQNRKLVKDHYKSEILREMAKKLIEIIRKNKTPDWYKRNDAKANMRSLIKRLLKQYKYPPEEIPEATELVIKQAELQMQFEEEEAFYFRGAEKNSIAAEAHAYY